MSAPIVKQSDLTGTWIVYAPLPSLKGNLTSLVEKTIKKEDLLNDRDITPPEGAVNKSHHITIHQGIVVEGMFFSTAAPFPLLQLQKRFRSSIDNQIIYND